MKNKKIIIILLAILVICCIVVGVLLSFDGTRNVSDVEEAKLTLTCESDSISIRDGVLCELKGNVTDYDVSAFSSRLEETSDFKIEQIVPDSIWEGDGNGGDVDLYTDSNKRGNFNILSFKVLLLNENAKKVQINLLENSFFDENFEEHKLKDVTTTLVVEK